jgi:hypothetical protein
MICGHSNGRDDKSEFNEEGYYDNGSNITLAILNQALRDA